MTRRIHNGLGLQRAGERARCAWAQLGASTRRGQTRRVELGLSRFAFSRAEIHAQPGETPTLALTSSDFVHGFSVPELNARLGVPPGSPHELRLPALPEGRFIYLCDNFRGEGHDKMNGVLVVAPACTANPQAISSTALCDVVRRWQWVWASTC